MDYSKKFCKGLCQQADDIGMCMGICSTSESHAQDCYDAFKKNKERKGETYTPIAFFERQEKAALSPVEPDNVLNKPNLR